MGHGIEQLGGAFPWPKGSREVLWGELASRVRIDLLWELHERRVNVPSARIWGLISK